MIYTNLFVFLTAIFLISIGSIPESPDLSPGFFVLLLVGALLAYSILARKMFSRAGTSGSEGYFAVEKKLSVLALVFLAGLIYIGDLKYYLSVLSFGDRLPTLVQIAGLGVFLVLLSALWLAGRRRYGVVFGRQYSRVRFVTNNLKANLPIVLPWIALSLVSDLLALVPVPGVQRLIKSAWGDFLFFGLFLILIVVFFPPLVRRLWGCVRLPDGVLRDHLVRFCAGQNFSAELYVWPLFEGRVLTAGVMGIVPGLRYVMFTPAILETMNLAELEAILAHEIGHVKKRHLLLYVLLIGGFSAMAGFLAVPVLYFFLSLDWVYRLMLQDIMSPDTIISLIGGIPLLILVLVYFRYIFGFFIRNFERQADLHVFRALGSCRSLIAAFEKIVLASGQRRDKPSWHHFGIGERIDHLERCAREPALIARQDKKVRRSLIIYVLVLATVITAASRVPTEQLVKNYEGKYIEMVLMSKLEGLEDKAMWFRVLGDLLFSRELDEKALAAYHKAFQLAPEDPELLNNLAWLLLTSGDSQLRDPARALDFARKAARLEPLPHVLDTLATAYWANGMVADAVDVERQALEDDPEQSAFYYHQLRRFRSEAYSIEKSTFR